MISFKNVSFSYGKKEIIKDFSLNIKQGERICLFGKSGCGKTTLLRLLLDLEKPKKGEILKDKGLKASVVFQENRLLPFKTVLENVTLFSTDTDTALYHLKALGLKEALNMYPSGLSGGMKRRVAIARALSTDFDFLCLDEAFTGLDSKNAGIAAEHILKTAALRPIILITHSLEEIELFGAKIIKV